MVAKAVRNLSIGRIVADLSRHGVADHILRNR